MDELFQVGIKLFETAPGPAALIAVAFLYFKNKPKANQSELVKKEDCHRHIDILNKDLKDNFNSVHEEIREIRSLLITHIENKK